jgi:hypothetical protein
MSDPFGNSEGGKSKAQGAADAVNKILQNLVVKCARDEGVRDFFDVGVIGYGASELANAPLRIDERTKKTDDGAGGLVEQSVRFPVWFEAVSNNGTPMSAALSKGTAIVQQWLTSHPDSFPPIVLNITDGESTDGDPSGAAEETRKLASSDGNVLLFNIHLSSSRGTPVEFPDAEAALPDRFAQQLFRMSSVLPDPTRDAAQQEGFRVSSGTRGFSFNADMVALIKFLDIGTRASNLR